MAPVPLKRLEKLVGDWKGNGTFTFDGKSSEIKVNLKVREVADGYGLQSILTTDLPDIGRYDEIDIWGYDAGENMIHMFSVTNSGSTHDHRGRWKDIKTLALQYNGRWDGKPYVEDVTIELLNAEELRLRGADAIGGEPYIVFESTVRRQKSRAA